MYKTSFSSLSNNKQVISSGTVKQKIPQNVAKSIPTTTTTLTLVSCPPQNIRPTSAKQTPLQVKQKQLVQPSIPKQPTNEQFKQNNQNINVEQTYQIKSQTQSARPISSYGNKYTDQGNQPVEYGNQQIQKGNQMQQKQIEDSVNPNQQLIKNQRPSSSQAQNSNQKVKPPVKQSSIRDQGRVEPLYDCPEGCGRSFNEVALPKHAKICKKVFQQKRKEFNSSKQRQVEQENLPAKRQPAKNGKNQVKPSLATTTKVSTQPQIAKVNWRAQSEAFRSVLKQGRGVQLDQEAMSNAQNLVPCKWCDRKFNETAAARHIPVCEKKSKENKMKLGASMQTQKSAPPQKVQTQTRVMSGTQKNKQY